METHIEQCPLCGSELTGLKCKEIEAKLRHDEQEKAADYEQAPPAFGVKSAARLAEAPRTQGTV